MLEVLQQDYIRTAHSKGMGQRGILFVHALKNAAVPIVTVIGIGIALLIGGAVVTESVFAIPGLGRLTVDAILRRDYPVIQGIVLLFSFVYVLVNLADRHALHRCSTRGSAIECPVRTLVVPPACRLPRQRPRCCRRCKSARLVRLHVPLSAIAFGGALLIVMLLIAILAPLLGTVDPTALAPAKRTPQPLGATSGSAPTCWAAISTRACSTARACR